MSINTSASPKMPSTGTAAPMGGWGSGSPSGNSTYKNTGMTGWGSTPSPAPAPAPAPTSNNSYQAQNTKNTAINYSPVKNTSLNYSPTNQQSLNYSPTNINAPTNTNTNIFAPTTVNNTTNSVNTATNVVNNNITRNIIQKQGPTFVRGGGIAYNAPAQCPPPSYSAPCPAPGFPGWSAPSYSGGCAPAPSCFTPSFGGCDSFSGFSGLGSNCNFPNLGLFGNGNNNNDCDNSQGGDYLSNMAQSLISGSNPLQALQQSGAVDSNALVQAIEQMIQGDPSDTGTLASQQATDPNALLTQDPKLLLSILEQTMQNQQQQQQGA